MKIINAIFAQNIGGVEQVYRDYGEALENMGYEVIYLALSNKNCYYPNKKAFFLKGISPLLDFFHLALILWILRPKFIICHSIRLMKWMKYLKYFSKTRSIAVNHGLGYKKSLNCDYVINVNQEINDLLIKEGFDADKSFIIHNAIKIDQQYFQKKLSKIPKIGLYGRLDFDKGFDILIKACEILKKRNIDFCLKLGGFEVGDDFKWQDIKRILAENNLTSQAEIVGMVTNKKEFFVDVDIFCVPSRHESFGMVILEGFLYSTFVISSKTDGGLLLIDHEKNGLLFENENHQDLANQIINLIENPVIYSQITQNAYKNLVENFSIKNLQNNLHQILLKIS